MEKERLQRILDKTNSRCHLCREKLSLDNYAKPPEQGGWEIEHSRPQSKGGSDHMNNLYAACVPCNRQKGNRSNQRIRRKHGFTKAPQSQKRARKTAFGKAGAFAVGGAALGKKIAGNKGALAGGVVGFLCGGVVALFTDPDKKKG